MSRCYGKFNPKKLPPECNGEECNVCTSTLDTPQMRARRIVKLAATKTEVTYLKEWFTRDEFGTWEKDALTLLDATAVKASQLQLTDEQVDDEIAKQLWKRGLDALELKLKKGG